MRKDDHSTVKNAMAMDAVAIPTALTLVTVDKMHPVNVLHLR